MNELKVYMDNVCRYKVLPKSEELELAKRVEEGDENAREKLILSNLRFVVSIANQFKGYTTKGKYTLSDLIQEGNTGLVHATYKFDWRRGYRLTSYATHWIKARIINFIIRSHSVVRVGTTTNERRLFFKLGYIRRLLSIQDPDRRSKMRRRLARQLSVSSKLIKNMEDRYTWIDVSTSKMIENDNPTSNLVIEDFLKDEGTEEVIERDNLRKERRITLEEAMKGLTNREKDIINMRYLEGNATLQKIATKYNLSRERIRQIETDVFRRMKNIILNSPKGQDILDDIIRKDKSYEI